MSKTIAAICFVVSFVACAHFLRELWYTWRSPQFKSDLERLREQRRRRIAAKRAAR